MICKICGGFRHKGKGRYCNPYCRYLAKLKEQTLLALDLNAGEE